VPRCAAFAGDAGKADPAEVRLKELEHHDFPLPKHAWARKATIASRYFESIDVKTAMDYPGVRPMAHQDADIIHRRTHRKARRIREGAQSRSCERLCGL